jgi:hypothetical protein
MKEGLVQDPNIAHAMANEINKAKDKEPSSFTLAGAKNIIFGSKEMKAAEERAEQIGDNMEKEKEITEEFFSAVQSAAQENKVYNMLGDRVNEKLGPMGVQKMRDNSFIVGFNDESSVRATVILQLTVNMNNSGKEINFLIAPYGPEEQFGIYEKDKAIQKVANYTRNYRQYHE